MIESWERNLICRGHVKRVIRLSRPRWVAYCDCHGYWYSSADWYCAYDALHYHLSQVNGSV